MSNNNPSDNPPLPPTPPNIPMGSGKFDDLFDEVTKNEPEITPELTGPSNNMLFNKPPTTPITIQASETPEITASPASPPLSDIPPGKELASFSQTTNQKVSQNTPKPADPLTTMRKPGGEDAPDPFTVESSKPKNISTINAEKAQNILSASGYSVDDIVVEARTPGLTDTPLAPPVFEKTDNKSGGSRKRTVVIIFGSLLLFLLLGIMGVILANYVLFSGDEKEDKPTVTPTTVSTPTATPIVNTPTATPTQSLVGVDLGPWTTPPVCMNFQDEDIWEKDSDNDLLTNTEERFYGTNPCNPDTVGNGYLDGESVKAGYDPLTGGMLDSDNDGIPDPIEIALKNDPFSPDTDQDGFSDCQELKHGFNPLIPSPNDKLSDDEIVIIEDTFNRFNWTLPDVCPKLGE